MNLLKMTKAERQIVFSFLVAGACAVALAGSFWMESRGFKPCPWCLAIRYTFLATFICSFFAFFKPSFFKLILFLSVLGIVFDFPLLKADLFPTSSDFLCEIGGSGTECSTPKFAGIFLSLWALFILLFVFALSTVYIIIEKRR